MQVRTDNCINCEGNQFRDSYLPLEYTCQHCGHIDHFKYSINATEIRELKFGSFLSSFPKMMLAWKDVTKHIASDSNLFSLTTCNQCSKVVLIPRDTPIELECDYCQTANPFPISNEVMDAFPPGQFRFEMRAGPGAYCDIHTIAEPQVTVITEDIPCPDCGAIVPHFEGFTQCQSCDKNLFAQSSCGKRVIPGLRVGGHLNGNAVDGWYSFEEFEELHNDIQASIDKGMDNIFIPFRFMSKLLRLDLVFDEDEKKFAFLGCGCFFLITSPFWIFSGAFLLQLIVGIVVSTIIQVLKSIFGIDLQEVLGYSSTDPIEFVLQILGTFLY